MENTLNNIRRGNYVKNRNGKIMRIDFIKHQEKGYSTKFGQRMFTGDEEDYPMTEYTDYATPIPLTEEWLYKLSSDCIIEKIEDGTFTVDRFRLIWKPEYKYWYVVDDVELTYITKVEYVHEWQNKYFHLNETELMILK